MDQVRIKKRNYLANPSQARFHRSRARVKGYLAGYGGGKTKSGGEESFDLAAENDECDGMIVAPTWGILHKVTLRAFFDPLSKTGACPPQVIATHNAGKRFFELVNGARVYYGSADRPGTLEGPNLAWWWLDEARLVRREAWQILVGRLREAKAKRLQAIITSTPAAGWLQDEFGSAKPNREVIHGSTRENAHNLAPGFIEDLERTYSARQAKVLIDGQFGLFDGAVYEDFDKVTHLVKWAFRPGLKTALAIDFGYVRPAVLWLQQVPAGTILETRSGPRAALPGTWVIADELMPENHSTEMLCRLIKDKGYQHHVVYCDPAGDGSQVAYGISDVQVLKHHGLGDIRFVTEPRLRHIPFGISLVAGMLKNVRGETRLFVAEHLDNPRAKRGIVKDLLGYHRQEPKDGRPATDMPEKDGLTDHSVDALRYFAINETLNSVRMPSTIPAM